MKLVAALLLAMMARADSPVEAYCARLHALDSSGSLSEDQCTILRASPGSKQIALIFTGGDFAEAPSARSAAAVRCTTPTSNSSAIARAKRLGLAIANDCSTQQRRGLAACS